MNKDRPNARILVSGDYPALQSVFVKEVRSARELDPFNPLLTLVSSRLLGIHLRRLLAEQGTPHFNLRFQTLEEFARETGLPNLLGQGKKEIPSHGDELIIGQIARTLAGQDGHFYFHDISDHPGFHRAVLATLKDLKDACLSSGQIGRLLNDPGTVKQLHLPKLKDFLKIWKAYEKRLQELGWFDESDVLTSACQQVKHSVFLRQTTRLIIYGFYDFNTVQKRLLQTCFNEKETLVFFPYEPNPSFDYVKPTLKWLKDNGFEESSAVIKAPETPKSAFEHLCHHLFNGGKPAEFSPCARYLFVN